MNRLADADDEDNKSCESFNEADDVAFKSKKKHVLSN
jgi:hypothetical protein